MILIRDFAVFASFVEESDVERAARPPAGRTLPVRFYSERGFLFNRREKVTRPGEGGGGGVARRRRPASADRTIKTIFGGDVCAKKIRPRHPSRPAAAMTSAR